VLCISAWQPFALGPVAFAEPIPIPKNKKKRKSKGPAQPKAKSTKRKGTGKKGKPQVLEEESESDSEEQEFGDGAENGSDDQDSEDSDEEWCLEEAFENPRVWGLVDENASAQEKADNRLARKIFKESASFGSRPKEAPIVRVNTMDRPRRASASRSYESMC